MNSGECRAVAERLTLYADGALAADERAAVERHLDSCPACRQEAAHERGGRLALRRHASGLRSESVPPALRAHCEQLARDHAASRRGLLGGGAFWTRRAPAAPPVPGVVAARTWQRRVGPAALSATVIVLTATTLLYVGTQQSESLLAAQLTADHMKCFKVFGGPDVLGTDAHEIEQALSSRFGWNVRVPGSSATDGIELIGASRCLYAEGLLPHVMYRVDGEDMSLYMLNGARPRADVAALGHRSRIWSRGETTYVLVSPGPAGELTTAERYVMREAQ